MQLEHNVHESSDLLNSDSLDDRADESPERSILRHSRHQSPATGHTVCGHTGNAGTGHTGHTGTCHTGTGPTGSTGHTGQHRSDRKHSVRRTHSVRSDAVDHRSTLLNMLTQVNFLRPRCSGSVVSGAVPALTTLSLRDVIVVPPLVREGRKKSHIRRGSTLPLLVLLAAAHLPLLLEKEKAPA